MRNMETVFFGRWTGVVLVLAGLAGLERVRADLILPWAGATSTPGAAFQVTNTNSGTAGANRVGVDGLSASPIGRGVRGVATADTGKAFGVQGFSYSNEGRGISGVANAASGLTYGAYGESRSSQGTGVFGQATSSSGETYGGWFESSSTSGTGVFGLATATSGVNSGVWGETASTSGRGVFGRATASTGVASGGSFESASTDGRGVRGRATASSGATYGGFFESASTSGTGVFGRASPTSGVNRGVWGHSNSSFGYGVYSSGRFAATGTKAFQIDHPLDPENGYLNHFCTEGPEPMNAYSGNVVTDANGYATIALPDYFETMNRDFRYQLTVVDDGEVEDFVLVKVVRRITNNQFTIRASAPFVEVSWRVETTRNDPWVRRYGFQTVQDKPAEHKGMYLHPELYGMPNDCGLHYRRELDSPLPEAAMGDEPAVE